MFLNPWTIYAQFPVPDFNLPVNACLNQNIKLSNSSTNAVGYEWDFCQGDLQLTPTATSLLNLSAKGSNISIGVDFIQDQGLWYGFFCSLNANSIFRLDFGTDINNSSPTVTNLGSMGGLLTGPQAIRIVKDDGLYYAFISNRSGNQRLTRLSFGSSITSIPVGDVVLSGNANDNGGLDIAYDGVNWVAVVTNNFNLTLVKFGDSLSNTPSGGDMIDTPNIANTTEIGDVSLIKDGNNWYGLIPFNASSKIIKLDFGLQLFNNPIVTDVTNGGISSSLNPVGIWAVFENGIYQAFIATIQGNLIRYDFGSTLLSNTPASHDITSMGVLTNTIKLRGVRDKSRYLIFTSNWNTSDIYKVNFPQSCSGSVEYSNLEIPLPITYSKSGIAAVTLYNYSSQDKADAVTKKITVSTETAPIADFTNQGICVNHDVLFSPNATGLTYNWTFSDGFISSDQTPQHQFLGAGSYDVTLEINSTSCSNVATRTVKIYTNPVSSYTAPTGLICTNNEFTFTNNTVDNFDGNLTYQWLVDNVQQSTSRDLNYAFPSGGNKEVKLITSIPGCADENVQVINNVLTGPTVGFTIDGRCEGTTVNFTNTSSGDITGYGWDSGSGQTSTTTNFSNTYPTKGTYNVSLTTTASNSCASTTTKPLIIYSKPQPNFSLDLPPFSCSGTPSQFNDLTPSPTDSNLSSWAWNFGDAGASTDRNPLHTFTNAGDNNVSLTATTNFGCSGSFQKSVTIATSPPADFTYTPACINQGTRFTDTSGTGVKSWFWTIGSNTYAFANPTHVFSGSGSYSAKLTVTGNNNCVATVTKTINVPVAPSLSFSVDNACEAQATKFKDTSPTNTDPAASWSWDFAGQGTATGNTAQYSFAKAGSYAVKMTSTQQSGCVYALSKNVTINATPVAAFTSSPEWGVPPLSVQFTNTSTAASSYSWHFNDKNNSTSTLASPGFQFTDLGDYVVDLLATSALGCSSSASGKISVIIPALDLELKQLQLVKDPASNVYRIFVTVKNKSNYLLTSVDVVVDISGNALIKETINTSLAPNAEVVQLLNNQILPHGNLLTYLCASIEVDNDNDPFNNSKCEPVEEETVVFDPYPNPSNGAFRFQWIAPTTDNAHFEIFNAMGQLAFEQYAEQVQIGLNQVQFDLNNLNTGSYYFRFSSNSTSKTLPIQIVR